ncbi:uncharacterized protein Dwil_GK25599 [Drosophila willistoni]|uniref:RING-type domain-containing protein n=1 Tax=Drosophila willistoni TaxID=7260 RepID=B4NE87_DROWI|nr:RING finger protein vilya [Drosophila willistoni]EDW82056.2 uncharacterized protein Dwil_GK25599 [Drosophila willistoni]
MTQISVPSFHGSSHRDRRNNADGDEFGDKRPLTPPMPEAGKLWIHCNNCFKQYAVIKIAKNGGVNGQNEEVFYLLACKHICCDKCVITRLGRTPSDAPYFVCCICRQTVRGRKINNSLPVNLKTFFHPAPWSLSSDEVNSFQMKNIQHLNKYKNKLESQFVKDENDLDLARKICQRHCMTNRLLVVERRKQGQRLQQLKTECRIRRDRLAQKSPSSRRGSSERYDKRPHSTSIINNRPQTKAARRRSITSFANPSNISFDL